MVEYYDTHAHLDFPEFQSDVDEVIRRAHAAGITRILSIGTTCASSERAVQLAERHPSVFAVVGIHPNHAGDEPEDAVARLRSFLSNPKVVAIGETGLDYFRLGNLSPEELAAVKARQKTFFRQQLDLAAEHELNCVIHQRAAFEETLEILAPYQDRLRGVFHCFSGTPQEAARVLEIGSLVSFTGIVTFPNAQNVRDALAAVPLGRFMLETDCPFLSPVPHRGRRCEPAFVRDLASVVAEVKGCTLEELSVATCTTARGFFGKLT